MAAIDNGTISSYYDVMRRKPGAILPIEESVLSVAAALKSSGDGEFHGFEMAKHLQDVDDARSLTAHGTLYKALSRMEKAELLESSWEDPQIAADDGRPRRRLYRITGAGEVALSRLDASRAVTLHRTDPGLATP
jgi:PadR family transcriptional regulator PadR